MKFPPSGNSVVTLLVVALVAAGALFTALPTFRTQLVGSENVPGVTAKGPGVGSTQGSGPGATGASGAPGSQVQGGGPVAAGGAQNAGASLKCAPGQNGGSTDKGVTATQINLASTLAESGSARSFLGDARYGLQAVINRVNAKGGICGRRLSINLVDDAWSASTGEADIRSFIQESYFALPVVPSSQGLDQAARSGDIDNPGIPVIGSDGMLISQYNDPWIWPVATSTISTAHIAALSAYNSGARTFGIVYDKQYKFGIEGEAAFRGAISRLSGANLYSDTGVEPGQQSYDTEMGEFINGANGQHGCSPCDFTFMLLQPDTAIAWIRSDTSQKHYAFGAKQTAGPQPLFVSSFAQACGGICNNMWVWTGFEAPYPPFDNKAEVTDYVNAVRSVSGSADVANQFLEGAYTGMELFVQALQQTGPNLTRARLRQTMDSMRWDSGLTQTLAWSSGNHYANTSMLGFTIQYSGGFNGFQYQQTGWVKDPWSNLDH